MQRKVKCHMPNSHIWKAKQKLLLGKFSRLFSLVNPLLVSALIAIGVLTFSTLFALRHVYNMQERIVREHLTASLNSFTEVINVWQHQNLAAIHMLANSAQGQALLKQVILEQGQEPQ
jgi:two-component system sensor histidine kinase/response regulator